MDEYVYNALMGYFRVLEKTGYYSYRKVEHLLILLFYYDLIYNDFRGYLCEEDYNLIDKALNCLYGETCLIPYPDYLKMGRMYLGNISELTARVRHLEDTLEETDVLKTFEGLCGAEGDIPSDIRIIEEEIHGEGPHQRCG